MSGNSEFSEFFNDPIDSCIFTKPAKGDFYELECCKKKCSREDNISFFSIGGNRVP